jgi:hypothetical protein
MTVRALITTVAIAEITADQTIRAFTFNSSMKEPQKALVA